MENLLIGCRATGKACSNGAEISGIIVGVDKYILFLTEEGKTAVSYLSNVEIHPEDVRFINVLSKSYKIKQKILEGRKERFEILDL